MSDTLSRAYRTAHQFAAETPEGNDKSRSLKLLARACIVTLALERSASEAADFVQSMAQELKTL